MLVSLVGFKPYSNRRAVADLQISQGKPAGNPGSRTKQVHFFLDAPAWGVAGTLDHVL
jgi:hypothetical protein